MEKMKNEKCVYCGENVRVNDDYEAVYCCAGLSDACNCMGYPVNSVICDSCEDAANSGSKG